jgi:hypothetical protein
VLLKERLANRQYCSYMGRVMTENEAAGLVLWMAVAGPSSGRYWWPPLVYHPS